MPTLSISEFEFQGANEGKSLNQIVRMPSTADQSITITGASAQSVAFNAATRVVRLVADQACRVTFAVSPVAVATSMLMPAGGVEYFGVVKGSGLKVAVIASV